MKIAFYLLLILGHIGVFDIIYFHWYRCRLSDRAECLNEIFWHTLRHAVYGTQFLIVANLRFHGAALAILSMVFIADVTIAWADVLEEHSSRRSQGGLPRGEYFAHIVLSLLVGGYLMALWTAAWPDRLLPAAIIFDPPSVHPLLRAYMTLMGATAMVVFVFDLRKWFRMRRYGPQGHKIVVEAIIPASVETVWERTQNPDQHVLWDIRFTQISYLEETDSKGFHLMDYRTNIGGLTLAGFGRYLHAERLSRSTFEFDSEDWKSIISRGRGIWQYSAHPQGTYFKTVYDYEARRGIIGFILDAFFFRRLMQFATEWGFETLRLWCAGDESALVRRRSRLRFMRFFIARMLGRKPAAGAARSWLGSGQPAEKNAERELVSPPVYDF